MVYVELIAGLILLLVAGDLLVRGSVAVARRFGVSPLVIGLTLVGFGTSLPELMASLQAALLGAPGIAVGNVVGSNIANILLILGGAAIIAPVAATAKGLHRDTLVLALATVALIALVIAGVLPRWAGVILVLALIAYTGSALVLDRREQASAALREHETETAEAIPPANLGLWGGVAFTVGGLLGVVLGARLLVEAAVVLAQSWGVSETIIGVSIVAIGTSLPELATSVIAALKKESDVALGNVVGSNIFNILGILGVTAIVSPLTVPAEILQRDAWVMLGATVALIAAVMLLRRIGRATGAVFVGAYAVYVGVLVAAASA
ncbi:calcium/sodium antiporter [Caenispirillum bisanense]|uniref:Cation:H+ antiporter n=1 Tax=Caenispirillum bisanense TaxID=414052 RepID=A0A286GI41_9PROT|nr:calcium/sodium antiporter [Caenispirillum bisanense]SOD95188.1 cation:H+ antiporter [Caenispirillum bisanense]